MRLTLLTKEDEAHIVVEHDDGVLVLASFGSAAEAEVAMRVVASALGFEPCGPTQ